MSINTLRIYRIVGLIFGTLILVYPYLVDTTKEWNPLWMHFALSGFVIGYTALSWVVPFVRRNFLYFTYIFAFAGCFWMSSLTFFNDLRMDFTSFTILTFPIAGAIFRNKWWLWAFFFSQFAFSLLLAPIPQDPLVPVYLYLIFIGVEMMGIGMFMRVIIAERFEMKANERKREERHNELLEVEKELMVLVANAFRFNTTDIEHTLKQMTRKTMHVLHADEVTVWLLHNKQSYAECSLEDAKGNLRKLVGTRIPGTSISGFLNRLDSERSIVTKDGNGSHFDLKEWDEARILQKRQYMGSHASRRLP